MICTIYFVRFLQKRKIQSARMDEKGRDIRRRSTLFLSEITNFCVYTYV